MLCIRMTAVSLSVHRIHVVHASDGCVTPCRSIIIIIIIKNYWQSKAGRGRLTPYESEDPSPTLPTYREKEKKWKIVEDKKGESN